MYKIGIDLDNTIINYDEAIKVLSKKKFNYVSKNKNSIKKYIVNKYGEIGWMKFQGKLYGEFIKFSDVYNGFKNFIIRTHLNDSEIYIISHKTKFGHFDKKKINLKRVAREFLIEKDILCKRKNKLSIYYKNIFFKNTIEEKIKKINELNLDVMIDDLPKVIEKLTLSKKMKKILFTNERNKKFDTSFSWLEIGNKIYGQRNKKEIYFFLKQEFKNFKITYINSGKNNNCFKMYNIKQNQFIKFYKLKIDKDFDRQIREVNSYKIISKLNLSPRLISYSDTFNYLITEFVNMKSISKLNYSILDMILLNLEKISKINQNKINYLANDNLYNVDHFIINLRLDLNNLKVNDKSIKSLIDQINIQIKKTDKCKYLRLQKSNLKFSISDIGIHNMGILSDERILFYDFEYSGLDDPIKLMLDFIYCPNNKMTRLQIKYWMLKFYKIFYYDTFINRFNSLNELISIKWKYLIIKHDKNTKSIKKKLSKIDNLLLLTKNFLHENHLNE